jgi:hypothetical protein
MPYKIKTKLSGISPASGSPNNEICDEPTPRPQLMRSCGLFYEYKNILTEISHPFENHVIAA